MKTVFARFKFRHLRQQFVTLFGCNEIRHHNQIAIAILITAHQFNRFEDHGLKICTAMKRIT
ncbi:Uncharacterised protein [Vibrio cholerae]|uniref:Uncharacterized protein n=1 Tax=Vibrio cholerae TaxID=666 RepID=A0A655VG04_VIBCL|nr:Uncharacterised protein [Vibrio cholerae]